MSHPPYVPDDPLQLAPGVAEMLADPNHYRRTPMEVVDYGERIAAEPPAKPASRWARLRAALTGRKP